MHCHCGTNNRVPRWTLADLCKPEVRPGAREESASPAWLATKIECITVTQNLVKYESMADISASIRY